MTRQSKSYRRQKSLSTRRIAKQGKRPRRTSLAEQLERRDCAGVALVSLPGLLSILPDAPSDDVPVQKRYAAGHIVNRKEGLRGLAAAEASPKRVLSASANIVAPAQADRAPLRASIARVQEATSQIDVGLFDNEPSPADRQSPRANVRNSDRRGSSPSNDGGLSAGVSRRSLMPESGPVRANATRVSTIADNESPTGPELSPNSAPANKEHDLSPPPNAAPAPIVASADAPKKGAPAPTIPTPKPSTKPDSSSQSAPGGTIELGFDNGLDQWSIQVDGGSESSQGSVDSAPVRLREGDSFQVTLSHTFTVPARPSTLAFTYSELAFDTTDPGSINDAFEAALLDDQKRSLVFTTGDGRDAFFNITEGEPASLSRSASLHGNTITLDISQLEPGTTATLLFRLVNNDTDTDTSVRIDSAHLMADSAPSVTVRLANDTAPPGPNAASYLVDQVTNDPVVVGTTTDDDRIMRLEAQVDSGPRLDITNLLVDSAYRFDPGTLAIGPHRVTLFATDTAGQVVTAPLDFRINAPPTADAGLSRTIDESATITLDASSSHDSEGPQHSFEWLFDDGTRSTAPVVSRSFAQDGVYSQQLTVTDTAGSTSTSTIQITVRNLPAAIEPLPNRHVQLYEPVVALADFVDPGVLDIHTATIDWGDGTSEPAMVLGEAGLNATFASHNYTTSGTFHPKLVVSDADGGQSETTFRVDVDPAAPTTTPQMAIDNHAWGYRERGVWTQGTEGWNGTYRWAPSGTGSRTASYQARLLPGEYEVFTTWVAAPENASNATYRIYDITTAIGLGVADQRQSPVGFEYENRAWKSLGKFNFPTGLINVELSDQADGRVVADGILFATTTPEGPIDVKLDVRLANDTSRNSLDFDARTTDPTLVGGVGAADQITSLRAGFSSPNVDITPYLRNGQFILDAQRLATINGGPLANGPQTLYLQAQDATGRLSNVFQLSFTLDTAGPALTASTPASQTNASSARITGHTEPNTPVTLLQTGATATSDAIGDYVFENVPLVIGANEFTVQATDAAGNHSIRDVSVVRLPSDVSAPIVVASLSNDSGISGDRITSDIRIAGAVSDESRVTLRAGIDVTGLGLFTDVTSDLRPDRTFVFTPARLAEIAKSSLSQGPHTLRLVASDEYGNSSEVVALQFTLDARAPAAVAKLTDALPDSVTSIDILYDEPVSDAAFNAGGYRLTIASGPADGQVVPVARVERMSNVAARLHLAQPLAKQQSYRVAIENSATDLAGNVVAEPRSFVFAVSSPPQINEISPFHGEELVGLTREAIVRFSENIDPATITSDAFHLIANGAKVPGVVRVSSTEMFATFLPALPLAPATEVRIVIDGNLIRGRDGLLLDADGDGAPGGLAIADFRTLPQTRIPGTEVWGWVYDAHNRIPTEHLPIPIPAGDPSFDPTGSGTKTIPFRRADFIPSSGTSVDNPRAHQNRISSFLDGSVVYGSDSERAFALRRMDGSGKLKTSDGELLPLNNNSFFANGPLHVENSGPIPNTELFVAGDIRAAENPGLAALHTIWVREHNRYADQYRQSHLFAGEEEIYQAARRWVSALLQHITYQEFLPTLVGPNALPTYQGYDSGVDPRVSAMFSTAAFRVGHTLQSPEFQRLDGAGQSLPGGALSLRNAFFNPNPLKQDGVDPILRGLSATPAEEVDLSIINDLRNFLFGPPGAGGIDLASIDIQRGRDMGLASYNQARIDFGLPAVTTFQQINSNPQVAAAMQAIYGDVDKVDALVGGLAEDHVAGGTVGSLFAAIIKDQFRRTRDGDRFWYENGQFTASDLAAIRATDFGEVLARNSGVSSLSMNTFSTGTIHAGPHPSGTTASVAPTEYRTFDGYGNNPEDPTLGRSWTRLRVDHTVGYSDGISAPAGTDRPLVRAVSNALIAQPSPTTNADGLTMMAVAWGQLLDHDLSLTPSQSLQGTDIPVVGATLTAEGIPGLQAVTDELGFFVLRDTPAPTFFTYIDGATSTSAPAGGTYASLGKPFHSIPGQSVRLSKGGMMPFNVYLPVVPNDAIQELSATAPTEISFQPGAIAEVLEIMPDLDLEDLALAKVMIDPGSAIDHQGNPATQAFIVPVAPDRLPAPLPDFVEPKLVVSIQAVGATTFDVPATVTLPNLENLAPGEKTLFMSFDHAIGKWIPAATMTVSEDGRSVTTDPGQGVRAPGWHVVQRGVIANGGLVLSASGGLFGRRGGDTLVPQTGKHFWAIENLDNGFVIRGSTDVLAKLLDQVVLPADTRFRLSALQLSTLRQGSIDFSTPGNGATITLPTLTLERKVLADSDNEGLDDGAEFIVGTAVAQRDTDKDGINDLAELRQGLDPFNGRAFPTGIISSLSLPGEAREITVSGSPQNPEIQTAFVATGSYGLAILDVTDFASPTILGQLDLPGVATDVGVDPLRQIAAIASSQGLHLVDVSDPMTPTLLQSISVTASLVEVADGLAYVSLGGQLRAYDLVTGELLQTLALTGGTLTGLAREGNVLYTMDSGRQLRAIDISGFSMESRGLLLMPDGGGKLFVGSGIAYVAAPPRTGSVGAGGYATANVSDPNNLALISGTDFDFISGTAPGLDIAVNGSGIGVLVGDNFGTSQLYVLGTADPNDTDAFLTRFNLPAPTGDVSIASGIALTASTTSGIQAVNYLSFDSRGQAPTVTMDVTFADVDPLTVGIQALEGSTVPVNVTVADDVQVRNVELLVNGQVVINDVSFPWDLSLIAPNIQDNRDSFTLQTRATDTGGNETLSPPVEIRLVPDTVAPTVIGTTPEDAGVRGKSQRTVEVRFSEPMDAATLTAASVFVRDTLGNVLSPEQLAIRANDRMVHLTYEQFTQGHYEIVARGATDRAGNSLGTGEVIIGQFEIVDRVAIWTGGASGAWTNPANWFEGHIPEAADVVVIDNPGTYQVTLTGNATIDELRLGGAAGTQTLVVNGTLNIVGNANVGSGGMLRVTSGAVAGDQAITVKAGAQLHLGSASIENDLILEGAMLVAGAGAVNGALISDAGSSILIQADGLVGNSSLTAANGFTNSGRINLESSHSSYASSLIVSNGALTNATSGRINVNVGGGGRTIDAELLNQGALNINRAVSMPKGITNEGDFNIAPGVTLDVSGAEHTFHQKNGMLTISGLLHLSSGAVFDYDGGVISGIPLLTNSVLDIAPGAPAASYTTRAASTLRGNVPQNHSLFIQADGFAGNSSLTSANGFTNEGTINLESSHSSYSSSLFVTNGALTNALTGELNVNVGGGGRTIDAELVNRGSFNVHRGVSLPKRITNEGTFRIAADVTLDVFGDNHTFHQKSGDLQISGLLHLSAGAVLDYDGGAITGRPLLTNSVLDIAPDAPAASYTTRAASTLRSDIPQNHTVFIQADGTAGNSSLTSAASFTNAGKINLESSHGSYASSLIVINGTLTNATSGEINVNVGGGGRTIDAEILNQGTFNVNRGVALPDRITNEAILNIASAVTLDIAGDNHTFHQKSGQLNIAGLLHFSAGAVLDYDGGSMTGTPLFTSAMLDIAPNAPTASFTTRGASVLQGDIPQGHTVLILADGTAGHSTLTSPNGFTNFGTVNLTSSHSSYSSNLMVTNGTLTNATLGEINVNAGNGGGRTIDAELINHGALNVNRAVSLPKKITNDGTFRVASDVTLDITGDGHTFHQSTGLLNISGLLHFSAGAVFEYDRGSIIGTPLFTSAVLDIAPTAPGTTFTTRGASTLRGNLSQGQTVLVLADGFVGHSSLTSANGFTNSGTINLESSHSSYSSSLVVSNGTLTNSATGQINVNAVGGGARTIDAELVNHGTLNVNRAASLPKRITNEGTFNIGSGITLDFVGDDHTFHQKNGSLQISGFLHFSAGAVLEYDGGSITGTPLFTSAVLDIAPEAPAASFTTRGASTLRGDLPQGQNVLILADGSVGHSTLTSENGFTNSGTINLEANHSSYTSSLVVTNGTLTNAAIGQINVNAVGGGGRTINAELLNQGTLNVNFGVSLPKPLANQGTINVTGANLTINSGANSFANSGLLNIAAGRTLTVSGAFEQAPVGTVRSQIASTSSFGRLAITGAAALGGALEAAAVGDYVPLTGQTVVPVIYASRTGQFAAVNTIGVSNGLIFAAGYGATSVTLTAGEPLQIASGTPVSGTAEAISATQLDTITSAAIARWAGIGLSEAAIERLQTVEFAVADLHEGLLGFAANNVVWIDRDAAGHGWFVDPTPAEQSEFSATAALTEFTATSGPAAGQIDLLTVVLHELGHVLSQADNDAPHDLMNRSLGAGIRRVPNATGLSFQPQAVADSVGKEFWLTFPTSIGIAQGNAELALFISGAAATTGTVTIAGLNFSKPFAVVPGQATKVVLPTEADLGLTSDRVTRKGIHVVADDDVSVYAMSVAPESSDGYAALPVDMLGTDYITLGYKNLEITPQVFETYPGTEFAIVATENDTLITITPAVTTGVREAGTPYVIELERGETYLLENFSREPADLSGTTLSSNKPIAVFGGHAAANVPAPAVGYADYLVEQLPPVESWGREFFTVPLASRNGDTFRVLAAQDGTEVRINGTLAATLDRGQLHEQVLLEASQIIATAPVLVAQYAHSAQFDDTNSDPFMMLIQPVKQGMSDYTLFAGASGIAENFINLVVPNRAVGAIRMNGQFLAANHFSPIETTGYSAASVTVAAGSYDLSGPEAFAAYVYGFGLDQSYGYPGGLSGIERTSVAVAGVSLSPEISELTVGGSQILVATVFDRSGVAVEGIGVGFEITGANARAGFAVTDNTGKATFAYNGQNLGSDLVVATVGAFDDESSVTWTGQAPTITLSGPADGELITAGETVLVTGRAIAGPATSIVLVSVNGQPVDQFDAAGNFFAQIAVQPGVNAFQFTAIDAQDQSASASMSLVGVQPTAAEQQAALFSTNVSGSFRGEYGQTSFNAQTNVLYADVAVRNTGTYLVDAPVYVAIDNISDPSVRVRAPNGYTPEGVPYYDFTSLVAGGELDPDEATGKQAIAFYNPGRVRFTYDLVFFAQLNDAPVIESTPVVEAAIGKAYAYQIEASDSESDALRYDMIAGPADMALDSSTGQISWSPGAEDAGTHTVAVAVRDDRGGEAVQQFTVRVLGGAGNRPPAFRSLPIVNANLTRAYEYQPQVVDADGGAIAYSLTAAPAGMAIDSVSGRVAWTPVLAQLGLSNVTLVATDSLGAKAAQSFAVLVGAEPGNHDPVVVTTPDAGAILGRDYRYDLNALDVDGDALNYTLVAGPVGMTVHAATGELLWPAGNLVTGPHQVELAVSDGRGGFAKQTYTLSALVNRDPHIVSTAPTQARVDQRMGYFVKANDPDNDAISYHLTSSPGGMSIDAISGLLTWTPTSGQTGMHSVTVEVRDARGGASTQSFVVNVLPAEANQAPVITSNFNPSGVADRLYSYQVIAADPNGDLPRFRLVDGPASMTIDETTGLIRWIPTRTEPYDPVVDARFDVLGSKRVVVEAFDVRGGVTRQEYTILVRTTDNLPPRIDSLPPDRAVFGQPYQYTAIASDPDMIDPSAGDVLTFELQDSVSQFVESVSNSLLIPASMTIDPRTGVLVWTPQAEEVGVSPFQAYGVQEVTIRVGDGKGGFDVQRFSIVVYQPNTPPAITSEPSPVAVVDLPYRYTPSAQDANNDAVTFHLVGGPEGMLLDPTAGALDWTPSVAQVGTHPVTIAARDAQGAESMQAFSLRVVPTAVNNFPTIASAPRTAVQLGRSYLYMLTANDEDGDPLVKTLVTAPAGMAFDATTGLVEWTPTNAQLGRHNVRLVVDDGRTGIVEQSFTIDVVTEGTNLPPAISSVPLLSATVETPYAYDPSASDADGDVLLFSLARAPQGMSVDPMHGNLRWTPTADQLGPHEVILEVADPQGGRATQRFTIVARNVNTTPLITTTPLANAAVDKLYVYGVGAIDADRDPLSIALVSGPDGMTLDTARGLLKWTPTILQVGEHAVEIRVQDDRGAAATQSYSVVVRDASENLPPIVTSSPRLEATVGARYSYAISAGDPEGGPVTYEIVGGPAGAVVDRNTGLVQWTPSAGQLGSQQVTLAAIDDAGARAAQTFNITVRAPNRGPQLLNQPQTAAMPDEAYVFDVQASDPDGDALAYRLEAGPSGMTIDPQRGRMTWNPTQADLGVHPVSVVVDDQRGALVRLRYDLTVLRDEEGPKVLVQLAENPVNVGETAVVVVTATDDVRVKSVNLSADGVPVLLDSNGRAAIPTTSPGTVQLVATVVDFAGNTRSETVTLNVVDPSIVGDPIVAIGAPIDGAILTGPINIVGTVSDADLLYYTLEVAPLAGGEFVEIVRGTSVTNNGVLGRFDTASLENGDYFLRLYAIDAGGNDAETQVLVSVTGDLKIGNFTLSFTDLSIPVTGIPITVSRTYDSLTAGRSDDFGYGWRMEFRDTDLRTSVEPSGLEDVGVYAPYYDGARVYVTLPGGKREGFTFKPKPAPGLRGAFLGIYEPVFVADEGITSQLTVPTADLFMSTSGEAYTFASSLGFNPEDPAFGGLFYLTTADGVAYAIDAASGDLHSLADANGNTLSFTDDGIISSTGKSVTFERDTRGRITTVVDPTGERIRYGYNAQGDLTSVTDRSGNITTLKYNEPRRAHFLTEIVDPLGRPGIRGEYDDQGRLVKMIDADGKEVQMTHDPANATETVIDQLGNSTTYIYDARGNVITEINAEGEVTKRTYDSRGNTLTETAVLEDGTELTTSFTYDDRRNRLTETDPLGNITRFSYQTFTFSVLENFQRALAGNTNFAPPPAPFSLPTTTVDALGNVTTSAYDSRGNLLSTVDAAGNATAITYFSFGLPQSLSLPGGNLISFEYDAVGNVQRQTDALGNATTFTYDGDGNQLSESRTLSTPNGVRTLTTTREYDAQGRVTKITDAEGNVTRTEYDAAGNRAADVDALGRRTEYRYDARGLMTETILPDATPENLYDNPRTSTEYDAAGRAIAQIDELGRRTEMRYDKVGRVIATIFPDATPGDLTDNPRSQTEFDAAGRAVAEIDERGNRMEYEYDLAGRRIAVRDALQNITRFAYDAAGRQTAVTDALGHTTQSVFDGAGRPTTTVFADGTSISSAFDDAGRLSGRTDQLGRATGYAFDPLGRLTAVVDALMQETEYGYDEAGNLVTQEDANDRITRYEYDGLGRRVASVLPLGQRSTTEYNAVGNVVSTTDFNGDTIEYVYDVRNRLVRKDFPDGTFETFTYTLTGQRETFTDARGVTSWTYDTRDRLLSRIDPDGTEISYTYDIAGNRKSVTTPAGTVSYTFDALNRMETVADPEGGITRYFYDPVGNLTRTELPNGTWETREYDDLNRLLFLENRGPSGVISSYRYTLAPTGRRDAVVEHDGRRVDYSYDALDRLTREAITDMVLGDRDIDYTYDPVGNRLTRDDSAEGVTSYTYDANDQLLTEELLGELARYTYDNNGNTLSRVSPTDRVFYEWDVENRLIAADTDGDGVNDVTNEYDADGIRVAQTVGGAVGEETRFLIDTVQPYAQVVLEYRPSGLVVASYVYGTSRVSQNLHSSTGKSFFYQDGLGSTRALSDSSGLITSGYVYDAYGRLIRKTEGIETQYLFAGEQRDATTGLDYLRARHYSSDQGRFFGSDPANAAKTNPLTLNRFAYALGNPINRIDPSGLFSIVGVIVVTGIQDIRIAISLAQVRAGVKAICAVRDLLPRAVELQQLGLKGIINDVAGAEELYALGVQKYGEALREIPKAFREEYEELAKNILPVKVNIHVTGGSRGFFGAGGLENVQNAGAILNRVTGFLETAEKWAGRVKTLAQCLGLETARDVARDAGDLACSMRTALEELSPYVNISVGPFNLAGKPEPDDLNYSDTLSGNTRTFNVPTFSVRR
jgi:RHS repeat-associated protein